MCPKKRDEAKYYCINSWTILRKQYLEILRWWNWINNWNKIKQLKEGKKFTRITRIFEIVILIFISCIFCQINKNATKKPFEILKCLNFRRKAKAMVWNIRYWKNLEICMDNKIKLIYIHTNEKSRSNPKSKAFGERWEARMSDWKKACKIEYVLPVHFCDLRVTDKR